MTIFSDRLAQLRKSKGVTQKALAEKLGVNTRTVQFYESGDKRPEIEGIVKIAEIFNVSVDYLVGKTEAMNIRPAEISAEEAEFLRWVQENVEEVFFFEFDKSPEAAKKQLMADLRYMWEREKKRGSK